MEDDAHGKKRRKPKKVSSELGVEVLADSSSKPAHNGALTEYGEVLSEEVIPLNLWIELEGCDPVPVQVRGDLTVHDLKLLLGGFHTLSHQGHPRSRGAEVNPDAQRQQIELLGLRGVRPQQIKLRVSTRALAPPSTLNSELQDGDTVHLQVVPSPIASLLSPATSSSHTGSLLSPSDPEITRLILDMRHELDQVRRRAYTSTTKDLTTSGHLIASSDPSATELAVGLPSSEPSSIANRLEMLEAKLDVKNTQLDTIMKEIKTLSLALRGMTGAVGAGGPPDKGPNNLVDGLINVKCKQTIEGHGGPVWALAKTDAYIVSGSSDTTVQAWDLQTMRPVRTMNGHTSIVHSVEVWNNTIISGSDDRCLKFWDMDQDFKCVKTIRANNVACVLRAASNHLFAGLYKTVKVWNLETGEFAGDLDNHNHWVRALNVTKGHLYSGCYNVINMIDLGTFKHMKSMTQNVGSIYSIVVDNNMLYAGTYANVISVYDLRTFECVRTLTGHTGAVYSLALSKGLGKLYSGSYDNSIRVWDLNSLSPIQRFTGHTSSVEALLTTDAGLYSASTDGTMKLWR
jgi:WD40 repeat protein